MKKRRNKVAKTILGIVLAVLIVAGIGYFIYAFFKYDTFEVEGNERFDTAYIQEIAAIEPETHMFLLNLDQIKENIEAAQPYLEVTDIAKKMPKTVELTVKEREPKALVTYADQYLLVDTDGNVLEILSVLPEQHYPVVSGIAVTSVNLGQPVVTEDSFKLSVLSEIIIEMEKRELTPLIATIDMSDINNITMKSVSGLLIKFGQADKVADKMKWVKNRLPAHERDGKTDGALDVSSGNFVTYQLDETAPGAQTTDGNVPVDGQGSEEEPSGVPTGEPSDEPAGDPTDAPEEG